MQFPQRIADVLEVNRKNSKDCQIMVSSDNLYEVLVHDLSHEVSLRMGTCACGRWDLVGIPCNHAICVINDIRRKPEELMVKATSLLHLKRQRKTKSEASISVPQSQPATSTASGATSGATSTFPTSSSAPPASATGPRRGRPPGRGQGRPPVRRQPSDP
ncbi:hypothetical protein YC2023_019529 [Brassica napus]